jgi:hypothetical protein
MIKIFSLTIKPYNMKNWLMLLGSVVVLASCERETRECPAAGEKNFNVTGFSKIYAGETHQLTITKGNAFSVKATGCTRDLDDLLLTVDNNHILNIEYKTYRANRYRVDIAITLPVLASLNLSGASKGLISGFGGQNSVIRTVISGASECQVDGTGINAAFDVSGASKLILKGNTESLYGQASGASEVKAYDVSATDVDIEVSGSSRVYVRPIDVIYASASGSSHVYYKGNPTTTHFETSGNSKIIHE